MFWKIFIQLCAEKNKKPNNVAKELGFGTSAVTYWKKGAIPRDVSLRQIADYFGVTVDYLLGKTESPTTDYGISENMIVFNLDGQSEKKKLTREQMLMLKAMLDALPDTPTDL